MRLGVSTKVFAAYAVLLIAFAATSAFSVAYLHGTRQHVVAHNHLLEVRSAIDSTRQQLEEFEQTRSARPQHSGTSFGRATLSLEEARKRVEAFFTQAPTGRRRQEFEGYRKAIDDLETRAEQTLAALRASYTNPSGEFDRRYDDLGRAIALFRQKLERDSVRVAEELSGKQEGATRSAIALGIAGLLSAVGAAVSLWRTLRPLQELRLRARQIASGDYAQRVGLGSRDEIGDLAREFDAMAQALQEREQRLIHSERLATVGKVAAQITHEIRNPLASIGLSAELLGDELSPEQREAQRLLGAISGEVDRLSEITESYLRFVRLPRPVLEREDPVALVTSVMEFARAELKQAGISLELAAPHPVPDIAADENQIRQALLNLIRNAREAMPQGGRLRVEVTAGSLGRVTVAVGDTGPGISPENARHIFEPFFSTKASGTGLGLALVQQIVAEHGGEVAVQTRQASSGAPGGSGTTFELTFPALPPALAPTMATPESEVAETPAPTPATSTSAQSLVTLAPIVSAATPTKS
jgi:two-component system NtrC family sensor kinase